MHYFVDYRKELARPVAQKRLGPAYIWQDTPPHPDLYTFARFYLVY